MESTVKKAEIWNCELYEKCLKRNSIGYFWVLYYIVRNLKTFMLVYISEYKLYNFQSDSKWVDVGRNVHNEFCL